MTLTLWRPFLPTFVRLALPGLVGVLSLYPAVRTVVDQAARGEGSLPQLPPGIDPQVLSGLLLVQPAMLTCGAVALGAALAPRVGLCSVLAGQTGASFTVRDAWAGITTGVAGGAALVALDLLTRPLLGSAAGALSLSRPRSVTETLSGVLYGGITEELLMRWGVMTLVVWLGWRLVQRGEGPPKAAVMWTATVVSSLLFGAAHLGAAATLTDLTAAVVVRTILLNALVGASFGWLYWRRNLETGMVAHGSWHVTVTLLSLLA